MTPPAAARRATAGATRRAVPPRRMSGPLRPAPAGPRFDDGAIAVPRPRVRRGRLAGSPFADALARRVRALPDHRIVDRLIGGRVWIPLVTVLLLGLVTMQLSLLKLNAGIGHAVTEESALQRENASLRATDGRLSDGDRVRGAAQRAGLEDPTAGSVRFVWVHRTDAARAAARMHAPSATLAAQSATATSPPPVATTAPAPVTPAVSAATTTPALTPTANTSIPAATTTTAPTAVGGTGTTAGGTTTPTATGTTATGTTGTTTPTAPGATTPTATAGGATP